MNNVEAHINLNLSITHKDDFEGFTPEEFTAFKEDVLGGWMDFLKNAGWEEGSKNGTPTKEVTGSICLYIDGEAV